VIVAALISRQSTPRIETTTQKASLADTVESGRRALVFFFRMGILLTGFGALTAGSFTGLFYSGHASGQIDVIQNLKPVTALVVFPLALALLGIKICYTAKIAYNALSQHAVKTTKSQVE